jgi:hypothetical protein
VWSGDKTFLAIWTALGVAGLFSIWVLVVGLVNGFAAFEAEMGVSVPIAVALYFVGGAATGVIIAVLIPFGRWLVGATVLGYVASLPVFYLFARTMMSAEDWARMGWPVTLVCGVIGAIVGAGFWIEEIGRHRS